MTNQPIYIGEPIAKVIQLHQSIIEDRFEFSSIYEELEAYADNLYNEFRLGNRNVSFEVSNYHPDFIGAKAIRVMNAEIEREDFQLVIAREYGFKNWAEVQNHKTVQLDKTFEKCVDDLLSGDLVLVKATLVQHPELINMRSKYGHQAALIHYLGSNGLEIWRQVVPQNLVDLLKLLIDFEVDLKLQAKIYGSSDLLALLTSSAHPWKAGVARPAIDMINRSLI